MWKIHDFKTLRHEPWIFRFPHIYVRILQGTIHKSGRPLMTDVHCWCFQVLPGNRGGRFCDKKFIVQCLGRGRFPWSKWLAEYTAAAKWWISPGSYQVISHPRLLELEADSQMDMAIAQAILGSHNICAVFGMVQTAVVMCKIAWG